MTVFLTQNLLFIDEAWFHLSEYTMPKNNRYWSNVNLSAMFEEPLHDQKIELWCAITAAQIAEYIFWKAYVILC